MEQRIHHRAEKHPPSLPHPLIIPQPESIEWFKGDQAFSLYDLAPLPPPPVIKLSLFHSLPARRRSSFFYWREGPIIRRRESLILYNSFNTLWPPSARSFFFILTRPSRCFFTVKISGNSTLNTPEFCTMIKILSYILCCCQSCQ